MTDDGSDDQGKRGLEASPKGAHFWAKVLVAVLALPVLYRALWPVAFAWVLRSRGDTWDGALYQDYKRFIWGPGLEIPTAMQFLAAVMAITTSMAALAIWATVDRLRIRRHQRRQLGARGTQG